jgi:hypothetical protein
VKVASFLRPGRLLALALLAATAAGPAPNLAMAAPQAAGPETADPVAHPRWLHTPGKPQLQAHYPPAGGRARGRTAMLCTVQPDGALNYCSVVQAEPAGRGFDASALAVATLFRMRPTDAEGRPTPGRPVLVRIAWPPPGR